MFHRNRVFTIAYGASGSAVCAALLLAASACNSTGGPEPTPTPNPDDMNSNGMARLAVFDDPDSEFSTNDVYDVNGDIIRLDTDRAVLIWAATQDEFDGWTVDGNDLIGNQRFRVRFGSESGQQRAYFTEVGPATVCDLQIGGLVGTLLIYSTSTPVPQS